MRKLSLTEWAAIGEVTGTVAIVISLLFVAYTIKQNTDSLQGQNENVLFERHIELTSHIIADPSMAEILSKMRSPEPNLSDIEAIRWERYQTNLLDIWALAYTRHQSQLLSDTQWRAWDEYFSELFKGGGEKISKRRWDELEYGFDHGFWLHVDRAIFNSGLEHE